MNARGFLTPCQTLIYPDNWDYRSLPKPCLEFKRLEKPGRWRCPACIKSHGPLPEEKDD